MSTRSIVNTADIACQPEARKQALIALTKHKGFRAAHPREDHFVPLYVAAGAGSSGSVRILSAIWGAPTFAFGL
jgi:aromatic ring-opening dioxygenase catalytic subunit (LigB family)